MIKQIPSITLAIVALLLTAGGSGYGQATSEAKYLTLDKGVTAHAGVDAIYRGFNEGYRKLDAAQVASLYTEEALYLPPGADIRRGRKLIEESFTSFFRSVQDNGARLEITFQIIERRVSNDLAYDVGIYTLTQSKDGSPPRSGRGKFVTVARRDRDGTWRFQVDTYNDLGRAR
jgi:uncharacterized protein (TIGR02246 family)